MMKLYYSPGACSLAAHIILEELQIPYEPVKVDLKTHKVDSQDYYKVNPQGKVPALLLDDGNLLTQNGALLPLLGDLDPQHHLIPQFGTIERVRCHEWLSLISADLHKSFAPLFQPNNFVNSDDAKKELETTVKNNIAKTMAFIDKKLPSHDYTLGEYFSVVDAYLFVMYLWARKFKLSIDDLSNYLALAARISERPAVVKAMVQEGLIKES